MSAALHVTREAGTTGPSPEEFAQFCTLQVLRFEHGNGAWYGRFTEVCDLGGETRQVTFSTIHTGKPAAIPEVCELATAFWAQFGGQLSGDDRCMVYIASKRKETPAAPPQPALLEWHKGKHGWLAHDGYRRHAHSVNGVLTIDPHDSSPHFQGGRPFANPPFA